jgi:putative membrane protein
MTGFLIRLGITALGLWLASAVVSGVHIGGAGTLVLAAFLLGFVNAVVRPILVLLTLPVTILTLGLFLLVINAGMVQLVAWLLQDFQVDGFLPALLTALIVSLTSWFASGWIGPSGQIEVIRVERR